MEDLSRRHLPPGPAMAAVLSPSSFAKLADHVGELSVLLRGILRDGMAQGYLPESDIAQLAQLIHGTLSSSAARGDGAGQDAEAEARLARTVRFIQLGAGARFDDAGRPVRAIGARPRAGPAGKLPPVQPVPGVAVGTTGNVASSTMRRFSRGQLSLPGVWSTSSGLASSL